MQSGRHLESDLRDSLLGLLPRRGKEGRGASWKGGPYSPGGILARRPRRCATARPLPDDGPRLSRAPLPSSPRRGEESNTRLPSPCGVLLGDVLLEDPARGDPLGAVPPPERIVAPALRR